MPDSHDEVVHDAPALAELFTGRGSDAGGRILDLGVASRRNFEFYASVATGVRFLGLTDPHNLTALRDLEAVAFERRLRELLPVGREVFDIVLTWTFFDHLGPAQPNHLSRHLAAISVPGARLHAMISMSERMAAVPDRFEIVGTGRLGYLPTRCDQVPAPCTPPAKIEAWLAPFRVEHAVVLRHGIREVLAILP
ncbi:MAG: hypothetical protein PVG53_11340 [Holophagae bacterium]